MQSRRDGVIFVGSVIACSLVLSYVARGLSGNPFLAVASTSVIVCARGASWTRKALYAGVITLGFVAFEVAFDALGLTDRMQAFGADAAASALGMLYMVFVMAYPLVVLLVFVGREPSALWTPKAANDRSRLQRRARRKKRTTGA